MNCFVRHFPAMRAYFILPLLLLFSFTAVAQTATLVTDQADYPPGSTATLTGNGFRAGESVLLLVLCEQPVITFPAIANSSIHIFISVDLYTKLSPF